MDREPERQIRRAFSGESVRGLVALGSVMLLGAIIASLGLILWLVIHPPDCKPTSGATPVRLLYQQKGVPYA
jgi:hypothetical protein